MSTLFGIDRFVLSSLEYRRVLLTTQLNVVFVLAVLGFGVLDLLHGYYEPLVIDALAIVAAVIALLLNRKGHFQTSRRILLTIVLLVTLIFTAIQDRNTGLYIFSICVNVGILAVMGLEQLRWSILLIAITTGIFVLAMFHPWPRISMPNVQGYVSQNLLFALVVATLASGLTVYYFLKAHQRVETMLLTKEKSIVSKNQELIKVNAELDKFFYSASHDLRAPLTSIQGLIQLMEISKDEAEIRNYIEILKSRASNLEKFIRMIGEYSSNVRKELRLEKVVVRNNLRESLENLRFFPHASDIKFMLDIPLEIAIYSDPVRMQVIFGNLLSNAIKYHDMRKPDPFIRISHQWTQDTIIVQIEDNGLGIPDEYLTKIFGMFFRAHRLAEGTGLGLFIVRETLDKLGGRIEVRSKEGQGSTFTVHLPRNRQSELLSPSL